MVTRFAPSPTGDLHLGHAFAAKCAHRLARGQCGRFLLRFEDIDHTRVRDEFYQAIESDLAWLGIDWDAEPWRQSERLEHYRAALDSLVERGVVYPCFCSRREIREALEGMAAAPHGPPTHRYPGTCRSLGPVERRQKLTSDNPPAWRLDIARACELTGPLHFHDRRHGKLPVEPARLDDVILGRKDIGTSYHLAVVVDDAAQGITLVTRGEDLLDSTPYHRVLQSLLGLDEPEYLHHELIRDASGQRLATRDRALSLRQLRSDGLSAKEVLALLPKSC